MLVAERIRPGGTRVKLDSTRILSVARYVYDEETHVRNHSHNFYHVLVVTGGCGLLAVNGEKHEACCDDVYFIPPGVCHEITSDPAMPLRTLEWKFYTADSQLDAALRCIPFRFNGRGTGMKPALEQMVEEAIAGKTLYKEMITVRSIELLLGLIRIYEAKGEKNGRLYPPRLPETDIDAAGDDYPAAIAAYIETHYTEPLTLTGLANKFHSSVTRLCGSFRKSYGLSPIQYVNELRLKQVKELLVATDWSVTEIAERVGFGSVHYLSRFFSRRERMSPLEYRQRAKRARHIPVEERYRIVNYRIETD
jgi:AraC-like DNA-binding protein/mannose-6-phosphate isomerase-like protein (cupin superfamily)